MHQKNSFPEIGTSWSLAFILEAHGRLHDNKRSFINRLLCTPEVRGLLQHPGRNMWVPVLGCCTQRTGRQHAFPDPPMKRGFKSLPSPKHCLLQASLFILGCSAQHIINLVSRCFTGVIINKCLKSTIYKIEPQFLSSLLTLQGAAAIQLWRSNFILVRVIKILRKIPQKIKKVKLPCRGGK